MLMGYKLTTKGFVTLTVLFLVLFSGLAVVLSVWAGADHDALTTLTPSVSPSAGAAISPSNSPALHKPDNGNTTPPDDSGVGPTPNLTGDTPAPFPPETAAPDNGQSPDVTQPPDAGHETLPENTPALPLSPYPDGSLQLMFPFGGAVLSGANEAALRDYLSGFNAAGLKDSVLVIEGRAYADEASDDAAVKALADARMQQVLDACLALGCTPDMLVPVSASEPSASASVVVGVSLVLIEHTEK